VVSNHEVSIFFLWVSIEPQKRRSSKHARRIRRRRSRRRGLPQLTRRSKRVRNRNKAFDERKRKFQHKRNVEYLCVYTAMLQKKRKRVLRTSTTISKICVDGGTKKSF
jgi:hypothetical protein